MKLLGLGSCLFPSIPQRHNLNHIFFTLPVQTPNESILWWGGCQACNLIPPRHSPRSLLPIPIPPASGFFQSLSTLELSAHELFPHWNGISQEDGTFIINIHAWNRVVLRTFPVNGPVHFILISSLDFKQQCYLPWLTSLVTKAQAGSLIFFMSIVAPLVRGSGQNLHQVSLMMQKSPR